MSQYKLYTSGPYKQNNGSAITRTSTDINLGAAKSVRDGVVLNRVENLTGQMGFSDVKGGANNGAGAAQVTSQLGANQPGDANGYLRIQFDDAHGLSVNQMVSIVGSLGFKDGYYRVTVVNSTTLATFNAGATTNQYQGEANWTIRPIVGTFGVQGKDNFIMMKNDATVHGQANSKLAYGASDYGRVKVAKFDITPKTTKIATAIRTDKYNSYNGTFDSGFPQTVTDTINDDDQTVDSTTKIGTKGELTFRSGGANPTSADYTAKTN